MKKTSIAPALAATVLAAAAGAGHAQEASHAPPTHWNDTSIGARYSNDLHFPGSASKVAQKIVTVNSTGGFKYGSYMFNVDFLKSDMNNPEANGSSGAQEVYSVGHVTWSFGKMLGRRVAFGPVRDVGFTTGYELSSKNDAFGSRARMVTLGPTLEFAVPRGFWNLTLGVRTEDNHNGISHADVHYDPAWHLESAWAAPLNLGPASAVFKGFAAVTGPKGKDGFHTSTTTETLVRASLLFDVGALVGGSPRTFYFGPGYEYWKNMFGTPASESPGTKRSAFMLVGEIHF